MFHGVQDIARISKVVLPFTALHVFPITWAVGFRALPPSDGLPCNMKVNYISFASEFRRTYRDVSLIIAFDGSGESLRGLILKVKER